MNVDWQHAGVPPPPSVLADFPRAAALFDTLAAAHALATAGALPPATDPAAVAVANIWYKPGRALRVVYTWPQADAAGPGVASVEFVPAATTDLAAGAAAAGALAMHGWNALARPFPADRALGGLSGLIDSTRVSSELGAALGAALAPEQMRWALLAYLPGERAALRLCWPQIDGAVVAKMDASAVAAHAAMRALWNDPGRRFGMAEPLLALPGLPARFERFVAGDRLEALEGDTADTAPALLGPVMTGLAALHGSPLAALAGLPVKSADDLLRRVRRRVLPTLAAALPELAPRATALVDALAEAVPPPASPRVLHGDLHTANLLLDPAHRVVFIDLDNLCVGDPALDLAQLGTRLALNQARCGRDQSMLTAAAALPALYAAAGGDAPDARSYAWYVAMLLVGRQIKTCIRHLAPDLAPLSARLLDAAEAVWQHGVVCAPDAAQPNRPADKRT